MVDGGSGREIPRHTSFFGIDNELVAGAFPFRHMPDAASTAADKNTFKFAEVFGFHASTFGTVDVGGVLI